MTTATSSDVLFLGGPLHGARFEIPDRDPYFQVAMPTPAVVVSSPGVGKVDTGSYTHVYRRERLRDLDGEIIDFMVSTEGDKPTIRSLLPQGR